MASELEKPYTNWEVTAERFVVFLDILGFKDMVARNSHEEVYSRMTTLANTKEYLKKLTLDAKVDYPEVDLHVTSFSDSIVLFSNSDSEECLFVISLCASQLVEEALDDEIPIKGAIAYGKISVDIDKQIFFGQPLIDAYLLQEDLQYYGIVCHHSIEYFKENFIEVEYKTDLKFLLEYVPTHFKFGKTLHLNINWLLFILIDEEDPSSDHGLFSDIIKRLRTITSGNPRKYIDNTVEYYSSMKEAIKKKAAGKTIVSHLKSL